MSLPNFSSTDKAAIFSGANTAVWHSHQLAWELANLHSKKNKPEEPDFVATMVTKGIEVMSEKWTQVADKYGIAVTIGGVFCHGHPQIEFINGGGPSTVELADLLVIRQHTDIDGKKLGHALLVQAKMSDKPHKNLSDPNDLAQATLYSSWPTFKFVSGGLNNNDRRFGNNSAGSTYALILNARQYPEQISWIEQCPWGTSRNCCNLEVHESFANTLGKMFFFTAGRMFGVENPRCDWAKTINEMLDITGKRKFRRANIGYYKKYRNNMMKYLLPDGASAYYVSPTLSTSTKCVGVSTLLATIADAKESQELEESEQKTTVDGQFNGISTLVIETTQVEMKQK